MLEILVFVQLLHLLISSVNVIVEETRIVLVLESMFEEHESRMCHLESVVWRPVMLGSPLISGWNVKEKQGERGEWGFCIVDAGWYSDNACAELCTFLRSPHTNMDLRSCRRRNCFSMALAALKAIRCCCSSVTVVLLLMLQDDGRLVDNDDWAIKGPVRLLLDKWACLDVVVGLFFSLLRSCILCIFYTLCWLHVAGLTPTRKTHIQFRLTPHKHAQYTKESTQTGVQK